MTNKLTTWGAIGIPFGVTLLIVGMQFYAGLWLGIMVFFGVILFGVGIYCVSKGIEQGRKYDKKADLDRQRVETIMNNLPITINIAVSEGIKQSGLQSSISEFSQLIKDLLKLVRQLNKLIRKYRQRNQTDTTKTE